MRLFIAEKPDLAKVIVQALGGGKRQHGFIECGDDVVTWCIGHLLELAPPEEHNPAYAQWVASDLPMNLRPAKYRPIAKTQDHLAIVLDLLKVADEVVHAGDPDDEGQLLVDEVLTYCDYSGPVRRVLINDLTEGAASKALDKLQSNADFFGLSEKARARSIGDQLYGFNMTRAYTLAGQARGHRGMLAVGRVQTVILGLIVNRYKAHKGHAAAGFYNLVATLMFGGEAVKAKFVVPADAPQDEKHRVIEEGYITAVADSCQGATAQVTAVTSEEKETPAPLPFALLDLQAKMSDEHGLNAQKTLAITQALREKHKAITYNRSDCNYLTTEQFEAAPATLAALARNCPGLVPDSVDAGHKGRAFNDSNVTAHTAIIPTAADVDLETFSKDERAVYLAIVKQYLAQFLPAKKYLSIQARFEVSGYGFATSATQVTHAGWTAFLKGKPSDGEEAAADDDAEEDNHQGAYGVLARLTAEEQGACEGVAVTKEKTKPPALYTEKTLLEDLRRVAKYVTDPKIKKLLLDRDTGKKKEQGGIGTPATRGEMLAKLLERGYYAIDNKKLVPTQVGLEFHDALPAIATSPDMTALWHEQQVLIEQGELTVDQFLDDLDGFIAEQIRGIDLNSLQLGVQAPCPMCGGQLAASTNALNCTADPCDFQLWGEVARRRLSDGEITELLTKGRTGLLEGFMGKNDSTFKAGLKITAEGKVEFVFPVSKKPAQKKRA